MEKQSIKANTTTTQEDGSQQNSADEIYEVESIVGMSKSKGKTLYLVKWVGYEPSWNTWEPVDNLDTCEDLIEKYLEAQKKKRKGQAKASTAAAAPAMGSLENKDIYTPEDSTDSERTKIDKMSDKKKKEAQKGPNWVVVDSSEEEFDTLKDQFWRDLDQGKVDFVKTDMYSSVKGSGARASRPQSFKGMFSNKSLVAADEKPPKKEKKKSGTSRLNSQEKSECTVAKLTPLGADVEKSKTVTVKSPVDEVKCITAAKGKNKSKNRGKDKKRSTGDKVPKLVIKPNRDGGPLVLSRDSSSGTTRCNTPESRIHTAGNLKDTFWADFENGKIDVFQSDMYSKVKGSGARSSRPQSCKEINKPLVQKDAPEKTVTNKKKECTIDKAINLEAKKCPPSRSEIEKDVSIAKCINTKRVKESEVSDAPSESSDRMKKRKPGSGGKFKSVQEKEKSSGQSTPNDTHSRQSTPTELKPYSANEEPQNMDPVAPIKGEPEERPESKPTISRLSDTSDQHSSPIPDLYESRKYRDGVRKKSESESSTEVPKKRKRKLESEVSNKVAHKKSNLQFEEFNLEQFQQSQSSVDSSGVSKLQIEDFTLDFDNSEKATAEDKHLTDSAASELHQKPAPLTTVDSSASQDSGVIMGHVNVDLSEDQLFDSSPVAGNEKDIDLLRKISEGTQGRLENINQATKDLTLDFIELDISELDISSAQLQRLQAQYVQRPDQAIPQILNQASFGAAVKHNEFEKVHECLKHCKKAYDLERADKDGVTLAMVCAMRGYDDMLELLARYGADINAETKNGTTALMMACEKNRLCTVTQLLHMGAHVNRETTTSCETALLKSVKRGYTKIASALLDFGCNYNSPTREELCASRFAKNYQQRELLRMLNDHRDRVSFEFENQVKVTLHHTASITNALFPVQCLALNESDKFRICFKHELEPTRQGVGMLLFIAHARVNLSEVRCRFYGPCAVNAVVLNDSKLHPLTEEGNFVLSFGPLLNGKNELEINTAKAPTSKAKLLVRAYTAQLT